MIDKTFPSIRDALCDIPDGATIGISGFGGAGVPEDLTAGLVELGTKNLTVVTNNAGAGEVGVAALLKAGAISKIVCSYPRMPGSVVFDELYHAGKIDLEVVPQGNLAERLRAAGAGIGGFFTPTAVGTMLAEGKETRDCDGTLMVFEKPIHLDYALIRADKADRWGNLTYRYAARNFAPVMATAAKCTIASVGEIVPLGDLSPYEIVSPSIFVDRIVERKE